MAASRRARNSERGRERFDEQRQRLLERGTEDHYLDTALYDHEYRDRKDDIDWYAQTLEAKLPHRGVVLELGAGTGRITTTLASLGFSVIALDRMPTMLDCLRVRLEREGLAEHVQLFEADMRTIPCASGSVDAVLAPFNTLMHLYTWQDLLACFREVHRVLRPGGAFLLDVAIPDLAWLMWDGQERHAVTRFTHPTTREKLVYSTNHDYDPQTQICHIRIFYDEAPPRGRRFQPPPVPKTLVHLAHRQIFPEELRMLIHVAGLILDQHTADFRDCAIREGSESQVVVCHKPWSTDMDAADAHPVGTSDREETPGP